MGIYTEVKTIKQAKELIIDRLKKDFGHLLQVSFLPAGQRLETFQTDHASGAIIPFYDGSKFSDSYSKNILSNDREIRIPVLIQVRVEKGESFKDDLIEDVIDSIAGIRFTAISRSDKIQIRSDEYLSPEAQEKFKYFEHIILFALPGQYEETNYKNYQ